MSAPPRARVGFLLLFLFAVAASHGCRAPATNISSAQAPTSSDSRLWGVWRATLVTISGADTSSTNSVPPPSLFILTRHHYSQVYESADTARAPFAGPRPTDHEKIAAFDSFVANSGTYRVSGNVLVLQPIVAKRPRPSNGYWTIPHQFTIRGDTMFTVDRGPSGSGPFEFRVKWVRIE